MSSKWFMEIIRENGSIYSANIIVDGKRVANISKCANYNLLKRKIREATGISIINKKDLFFDTLGFREFAYLDNTQYRGEDKDCRVTLNEIVMGYRPKFDASMVGEKVYIYPSATHALNIEDMCILGGTITKDIPGLYLEATTFFGNKTVLYTDKYNPDGSFESINKTVNYYDTFNSYETSLEAAQEKAAEVYKKVDIIKGLPLKEDPAGSYLSHYFSVIDIKAMTDLQLIAAIELAKEFVGPMSNAVGDISREMRRRFISKTLETSSQGDMLPTAKAGGFLVQRL